MIIKNNFLFIFLLSISAFTQKTKKKDTARIISYVDKLIIKVNMDTQTDGYTFLDNSDNSYFHIQPNDESRLTLSLDYEFIGASIGYSPKFLTSNNDNNRKGESSFTNFSFRFFLGNWTQGIQYSKIQGYYIENTRDFMPEWAKGKDPYIQFPNLKFVTWKGTTSYVVNPNFSLRNIVYQTEWQRKSAGSFIPELEYGYTQMSNQEGTIKSITYIYDIELAASYYYTFVIHKNWFISPFISPSVGIRFSKDKEEPKNNTISEELEKHQINRLKGGLQLGYSSRKIIFGANINFNVNWYNEGESTSIINDKSYAKLYFGYRFNAPKFIQKPFKWVNKQFGQ